MRYAHHLASMTDAAQRIAAFAQIATEYATLRREHPTARALDVHRYIRGEAGMTFEQFSCRHEFAEDPSDMHHGEGRIYCLWCGLDGDG